MGKASSSEPPSDAVHGIRTPSQARGQEALNNLLQAGAEVLAERGANGFTLAEVSRRAHVSYGAMYWRIESKEALLNAIHERFDRETAEVLIAFDDLAEWADEDVFGVLDRAVRMVAAVFDLDPPLLRALSLQANMDPQTMKRATESVHRGALAFNRVVVPALESAGHPAPERIACSLFTIVTGAMSSRVTWPDFHFGPELTWSELVDDLSVMAAEHVRASLGPQS